MNIVFDESKAAIFFNHCECTNYFSLSLSNI